MEHKMDMTLEMRNLRNKMKTVEGGQEDGRPRGEMKRKVKLLEEQVQYLEQRLESCRQEGALKMSSIEGLLGNENSKLKAREKDLRRKLQRAKETNKLQEEKVIDLTAELKHIKDEMRSKVVSHCGWMKHVRLPAKGEWPAIKLDNQQNKKALRHIFQQVEREGGPPISLDPSLFLHCVVLFLWWKREATVKMLEENVSHPGQGQTNSGMEDLRSHNLVLQQRVKALEDALGDCRVERQTFETTISTNLNQLLTDKYDLSNKVARLEDTVSALHLDNNLLRAELNDQSASQRDKVQLDELIAEQQARLQSSEFELQQKNILKEKMEIDLRRASKHLQTLEQDAKFRDTVCKEHTERLISYDIRRAELEKMTSESQEKVWSLQHDLKHLEESHNAIEKERDSFLSQLTKAQEQFEDARETIREISDKQIHCTKMLKHQDEIITNLQRDATNHREAQAKLIEEKEKRRSLDVISTNHERLVREMEERMRMEEVDSATLLAELCGAQSEERSRLEGQIETLKKENEEMEDAIETLSNEKATLQAKTQKLKLDFDRVCTELHTLVKWQAMRMFQTTSPVARRPGESTDALTSTKPVMKRSSPVGGEECEKHSDKQIWDLRELIDLLVEIKGTDFGRWMLGGVDGDSLGYHQDIMGVSQIWEEMDEARMGGADGDEKEEEEEDMSEYLPTGKMRQDKRGVIAKLRALALMMQARQKLREKRNVKQECKAVKGYHDSHAVDVHVHDDVAEPQRYRDQDSYDLIDEPVITKQEQPLLLGPVVLTEYVPEDVHKRQMEEHLNNKVINSVGAVSQIWPADTVTDHSSEKGTEENGQDQTLSDSENDDLLSTLERERERLKMELTKIKEKEDLVQEDLQREQEAHLLYLRRVSQYQDDCVRMQQEKEELLKEPPPQDDFFDDETNRDRVITLDVELERMLLEEMKILKEENGVMNEKFQQRILDNQREGLEINLQELEMRMPSPHQSQVELPQQEKYVLSRERPLVLDDCVEDYETNLQEVTNEPTEVNTQSNLEEHESQQPSPKMKDEMVLHQKRSLRHQPNSKAYTNQNQGRKASRTSHEESRKVQQEPQMSETEEVNNQAPANINFDLYSHQLTETNSTKILDNQSMVVAPESPLYHTYISQQQNGCLLPELEAPTQQTLASKGDVSIVSTIDAPKQADSNRQALEERIGISEFDQSNDDERVMIASFSEPGDKPEADQDQEHYVLETKQLEVRRQHYKDLAEIRNGRDIQNARSKRHLQTHKNVEQFGAINETWGKAEASGGSLTYLGRKVMPSQQDSNDIIIDIVPNKNKEMVWGTSKTKGVDGKETVRQSRTDSDRKDTVTVALQEANPFERCNSQTTTLQSKQKCVPRLPKHGQREECVSKRSPGYPQMLEDELSDRQMALLELHKHRGRQDCQDKLTAALQTEVTLQKLVDGLQTKVSFLQIGFNESADLVAALQKDKVLLKTKYTAAQEERQSLQGNLKMISDCNKELKHQLQASKEHAELLKKEHKMLKKRFVSETERNAKMQREIVKLEDGSKFVSDKQVAMGGGKQSSLQSDTVPHQNTEQQNKKRFHGQNELTMSLNDDATKEDSAASEIQVILSSLEQENTKLQNQLTKTKQVEFKLQREIDSLHKEAESLHSPVQISIGVTADLQQEIDSMENSLAAANEDGEGEGIFRQKEEKFKRQLEEQIDQTFDLENQLDDNQTLVKELEQERNILQDDFITAVQVQSQLKSQLGKMEIQCQTLTRKLEDSQAHVESLKQEMGEYLEQDTQVRDEEARLSKKKLRELQVDCQHITEEPDDAKPRKEKLEVICKMYSQRQKRDEAEQVKLKAEIEKLQREKQQMTRELIQNKIKLIGDFRSHSAIGTIDNERKSGAETSTRQRTDSMAKDDGRRLMTGVWTGSVAAKNVVKTTEERRQMTLDVEESEYIWDDWRKMKRDDFDHQYHDMETNEDSHKSFESACADIGASSDCLQKLDETLGTSVIILQEELETQTINISRLRESTEATLQQAVTKTKELLEDIQQEMASVGENGIAVCQNDTPVTTGQSLNEMRKQMALITMLQQTLDKALRQHSALKIRLRQQMEKVSGILYSWQRERRSLKKQLGEHKEVIALSAKHNEDRMRIHENYEETLKEMKKENLQLSLDHHLASESQVTQKQEYWKLHESLQDSVSRERELTNTLRQVQDQLKMEVEMQAQLAKRSESQEMELFKLRTSLGRNSVREEGTTTKMNQEQNATPTSLNKMLTDFSCEIHGHLESHMEKTQLQNDTDDRKKIQELECQLSNLDVQLSVNKITVQSLTDDNSRLRTMVYKLRERIANNQISHHKNSRMDAVYQALARAQVRVIATSMADGSQTILTGADVFSNMTMTGLAASRMTGRHHMGSAGNSLEGSYD